MIRLCLLIAIICASINLAHATTRLNSVTGEAEVTPDDGREWTTQLNPITGEASVQPVGAAVELNAVTGEAEWDSGHNE